LAQALLHILPNAGSSTKMLRITENAENGNIVRLRLDGTGVVFMNNEVASKLARLRSEQLKIINCSPFIEALLNTVEKSDAK
jgi:hypothetical protein